MRESCSRSDSITEDGVAGLRIAGCIVQTEFLEEFIHGHGDRDPWYRDRYCGPFEVVIPRRGHGPRPEICECHRQWAKCCSNLREIGLKNLDLVSPSPSSAD